VALGCTRLFPSSSWAGAPTEPGATLFARVAEVELDAARGTPDLRTARTIAAAAPARIVAPIALAAVPNGDRRVVLVEVRETSEPSRPWRADRPTFAARGCRRVDHREALREQRRTRAGRGEGQQENELFHGFIRGAAPPTA